MVPFNLLATAFILCSAWSAKWIGPAPETRADEDMGDAQWITAPAGINGVTTVECFFECPELMKDAVVDLVCAGVPQYEIEVNGRLFYRWKGHVRDSRYPLFRNMTPWLMAGKNTMRVRMVGDGERAFIAKITLPNGHRVFTNEEWTSPLGSVKLLGTVRATHYGKELILRTEKASPAFAKHFTVRKKVASAVLRVTGVGFYEAYLNGRKIGDKVLDPSPTDYDKRVLYSQYDLSKAISMQDNELVILLGHGWYDNRAIATWNFEISPWRDFPRTIAQLDVVYMDGTSEVIGTDASWRHVANPIVYDDVYEGEVIDGRIQVGKSLPGGSHKAVEVAGPAGKLEPELQPGAKICEEIRASAVHPLGDDSCMVEFPVNVSGWMRMPLFGQQSGDVLSFRYDERINTDFSPAAESVRDGLHDDGAVMPLESRRIDEHFRYTASHRFCAKDAAFQCDRYICRGEDGETYEPHFTYKGFRYVYVRGLRRMPRVEDVVACFIHTDFKTIGSFDCSNEVFNRLMEMGKRSYECNFTDGVPTDCPHREKNGWTGDASIASELAQYLFENTAGYEKWLMDLIDTQRPSGELSCIAPTSGWGFVWGNGPGWDSALPVIAWNLWIYRGNRRIIAKVYPALKKYLDYTATRADANGLVRHGLGDWVPVNRAHIPTVEYTSSCYYYQAQRIAAEMAKILGYADDARSFEASAAKTHAGLRGKYRKADGVWDNGGQTAQGMALAFGLPMGADELRATQRQLVASVERTDCHVDMGLFGTKHVFRALSRSGRTDLAWKMLTNKTAPSPVMWLQNGGTTLWEDWTGDTSMNHIMFGDFVGWAYQYLAGIRIAEMAGSTSAVTLPIKPAFRKVVINPIFLTDLDRLSASIQTSTGILGVSWCRQNGQVSLTVEIPKDTDAEIHVPNGCVVRRGSGIWHFDGK